MGFGAAEDAFRHHRLWPQRRFPGGHDFSPFILVVYGATWIYLQVSSENNGKHCFFVIVFLYYAEHPGTNELLAVRDFMKEKFTSNYPNMFFLFKNIQD